MKKTNRERQNTKTTLRTRWRQTLCFVLLALLLVSLLIPAANAISINGAGQGISGATSTSNGAYAIKSDSYVLGYRFAVVRSTGATVWTNGLGAVDIYCNSLVSQYGLSEVIRPSTKYTKMGFLDVADEMAYSPAYTTFVKGGKIRERLRRFVVRVKNWKKALIVRLGESFNAKLGKYI